MAAPDLQQIHDDLFELALKAGTIIVSANPQSISTKKNSSDLVTETDKAVEELVSSTLKQKYPDYGFLGEETSTSGTLASTPTFVCDPIDGTTNFIHGHPYVSISLAFCQNRRSVVGIIYNPFIQHLYSAIKGQGAYLTAPSIPTSLPPTPRSKEEDNVKGVVSAYTKQRLPLRKGQELGKLDQCLVAVEWGNEREGNNYEVKTQTFKALAGEGPAGNMVHSLRSLGSAALNCCAVARGDLDAYWEGGCWAWDIAAGWIIVEEAGGQVVGGNQDEWNPDVDGRRYLVVRGGSEADKGKTERKSLIQEFWGALGGGRLQY